MKDRSPLVKTSAPISVVLGFVLLAPAMASGGTLHRAVADAPRTTMVILTVAVALAAWPRGRAALAALASRIERVPPVPFRLALFLIAFGAYAAIAWLLFKGVPRIDDGVAALFQARIFARGRLTLAPPPLPEFFELFGVLGVREGLNHWCGMYPPGWPLLLTPGIWLGVPWLVNPALGGLLVIALIALGRELYDERTGRIVGLLALPSPFLAIPSALHLSHTATNLGLVLSFLWVLRLRREGLTRWGAAAGACWGLAFLCRPLDAVVTGIAQALALLWPPQRPFIRWKGVIAGLAVALIAVAALAGFQAKTTGHWRTPGHVVKMGVGAKFGFGRLSRTTVHTPAKGLDYTARRLRALNENLLGWPGPDLAIVLLLFLLGRARWRELWLLLPLPMLALMFLRFWYFEICFPGRYLLASVPNLFVLASAGLMALSSLRGNLGVALAWALALSGAAFLFVRWPHHARAYGEDYYDVENLLPRVVRDYGICNAVVFMDSVGLGPVRGNEKNDYYATGFMRNRLDLNDDVLFARNLREHNAQLAERYPGRDFYLYRYDRERQKALLYRMTFPAGEMCLTPVTPKTPDVIKPAETK